MPLRPLGKFILCERLPDKNVSPGGIALPWDRDPTTQARVVRVGPDVDPDVCNVEPGQLIMFVKSQYEIGSYEGREVLFVNSEKVVATLEE